MSTLGERIAPMFEGEELPFQLHGIVRALVQCANACESVKHHGYGAADLFDTARNNVEYALGLVEAELERK